MQVDGGGPPLGHHEDAIRLVFSATSRFPGFSGLLCHHLRSKVVVPLQLQSYFAACEDETPAIRNHDKVLQRLCEHLDHALLYG